MKESRVGEHLNLGKFSVAFNPAKKNPRWQRSFRGTSNMSSVFVPDISELESCERKGVEKSSEPKQKVN